MKLLLKSLLVFFGVLNFVCLSAQNAVVEYKEGNITYKVVGLDSVVLLKCATSAEGDVDVKSFEKNGRLQKIVAVADFAFENCEDVARVNLPSTISSIGYRAFYGCRNLSSINVPNSVTSIGVEAFNYCTGLQKIFIPASVSEIGDGVFWHDWALKSISVDIANRDYVDVNGVLFSKNLSRLIAYPAGKIEQSYTIPSNTTTIGTGAFAFCKDLTTVIMPKDMIEIRRYAFQECTRLTSITIPNSIDVLETGTFNGCIDLSRVVLPKKMKRIGNKVFENCVALASVVIPDGVTELGDRAMAGCKELHNVAFPRTLKNIGVEAFADCEKLATIHLFGLVPPKVEAGAFMPKHHEKTTLYAKYNAIDSYRHADDWTNFEFVYTDRATYRPYGINY